MIHFFHLLEIQAVLTPLPLILFVSAMLMLSEPASIRLRSIKPAAMILPGIGTYIAFAIGFYEFIVDDVYISLRYARNLADGHGLVFNTGNSQPVEGYTNFLWVVMQTPLFLLNLSDEVILHIIRITGVLFGLGVIVLTYLLINLFTSNRLTAALGSIFLAAVPEFAFWAVGGLETPMYMFWMMLSLYSYLREKRKGKPHLLSLVFLLLTALTRPEGLFFALAVLFIDGVQTMFSHQVSDVARRNELRQIGVGAAIFLVVFGVYFLWRYSFYGLPFPNTFYAKKISSSDLLVHRIKQVSEFFIPLIPFFIIGGIAFFRMRNTRAQERNILGGLLVLLVSFSFIARNEWMPGFRYELPLLPLLMVFAATGVMSIFDDAGGYRRWHNFAVTRFSVFFLSGLFLFHGSEQLQQTGEKFARNLNRSHVPLGKWLKKYAPENASYASWDMGAVPYYSGMPHIVDINSEGLLNTHTTFHGYDIDRFLENNPSFLVLPPDHDYVRPAEIRDFYSHEKVRNEYEFLFSLSFDRNYLLHVFKHRDVILPEAAITEGRQLEYRSSQEAMYWD